MRVKGLPLPSAVKKALDARGIDELRPVQASVFDAALEGRDILARARTGDGKTLAYLLPLVAGVLKGREEAAAAAEVAGAAVEGGEGREGAEEGAPPPPPPAAPAPAPAGPAILIVLPTRELAAQVFAEAVVVAGAAGLQCVCVGGGTDVAGDLKAIDAGVDVLVGTPGRLRDLKARGKLPPGATTAQVLDEADRLLGEGFMEEVEAVMVPRGSCQTLMLSATIPAALARFAARLMRNDKLSVDHVERGEGGFSKSVEHIAVPCRKGERPGAVAAAVQCYCLAPARAAGASLALTLVFAATKVDADELAGGIAHTLSQSPAGPPQDTPRPVVRSLHGDMEQADRSSTLAAFRAGRATVLVATDVAARGLDIPGVELVVHAGAPGDPDTYVHRAGRAGRPGCATGGVSLVLHAPEHASQVGELERQTGAAFRRAAGVGADSLGDGGGAEGGGAGGGGGGGGSRAPVDAQPLLQGDFFGGLASDVGELGLRAAGGGGGKKKGGGKKGGGRR